MAKKYICKMCGQTFEADSKPDKCPICSADSSLIEEVGKEGSEASEASAEKKSRKLNTNGNAYTIIYAAVMVIIVAFLLAGVSILLKSRQEANVEIDRQSQVLASLRLRGLEKDSVTAVYTRVVEEGHLQGSELPLFTCHLDTATVKYVVPVKGRGLWGGLWGYVAVNADGQGVYGAYFSHESETAGLGALIAETKFQELFNDKQLFADSASTRIALTAVKNGKVENPAFEVDGITGATLTTNGVADMVKDGLQPYAEFFRSLKDVKE